MSIFRAYYIFLFDVSKDYNQKDKFFHRVMVGLLLILQEQVEYIVLNHLPFFCKYENKKYKKRKLMHMKELHVQNQKELILKQILTI